MEPDSAKHTFAKGINMTFVKMAAFGVAAATGSFALATSASAFDWQARATAQLGYAKAIGLEAASSSMAAKQAQISATDAMAPLLGQLKYPYTSSNGTAWTYIMVTRYNNYVNFAASDIMRGASLFNSAKTFNVKAINEISEGDVNFQQGLYYNANSCYYNATYDFSSAKSTFDLAKYYFNSAKFEAESANAMNP